MLRVMPAPPSWRSPAPSRSARTAARTRPRPRQRSPLWQIARVEGGAGRAVPASLSQRRQGGRVANRPHRHVRLRLARQRPGPDRMRPRARDEPQTQSPWRRIPWTHLGAVIGALAAIGGLIFTAVATYYSAAVSSDQLQQSREDAEREERAQASRVSFWFATEASGRRLHVMNRSPDPVTEVTFGGGGWRGPVLMTFKSLALCQDSAPPNTSSSASGAAYGTSSTAANS